MKRILAFLLIIVFISCNSTKRIQRRQARLEATQKEHMNASVNSNTKTTSKEKTVTVEKIDTTIKGEKREIESKPVKVTDLKPGSNTIPVNKVIVDGVFDSLNSYLGEAQKALSGLSIFLDTATNSLTVKATTQIPDKKVTKEKTTTTEKEQQEENQTKTKVEATKQNSEIKVIRESNKDVKRGINWWLIIGVAIILVAALIMWILKFNPFRWVLSKIFTLKK